MGFGFRVAPGVRVYPGGRGVGVSVRSGRVSYYTRVAGGTSTRSRGPSRASLNAHERAIRQARRAQEIETVAALDGQLLELCRAHVYSYENGTAPGANRARAGRRAGN